MYFCCWLRWRSQIKLRSYICRGRFRLSFGLHIVNRPKLLRRKSSALCWRECVTARMELVWLELVGLVAVLFMVVNNNTEMGRGSSWLRRLGQNARQSWSIWRRLLRMHYERNCLSRTWYWVPIAGDLHVCEDWWRIDDVIIITIHYLLMTLSSYFFTII